MDDRQKTPRGHLDFNSYVKILHVFIWNGRTDRQTEKYTHCARAGGTFFQMWFCVSFWFWQEIGFGFTYLCT